MAQLITERFAFSGGKVDRSGPRPIVRGVLLCGATSANRRRYRKEAFAGDRIRKYEGRPVFLNHGDGRAPRRYEDRIAKVINARRRGDGMPIGDLEVRPRHPYAEAFLDDAANDPNSLGMSHVAHAKSSRAADGWEDVNSIESVESVDIVLHPATTKGLYEQTNPRRGVTTVSTVRRLIEQVLSDNRAPRRIRAAARALREELAPTGEMDAPADDPGGEAGDKITAAFKAAALALVEKAFDDKSQINAVLSKLRKMFTTHTVVSDDDGGEGDDFDGDAEESRRRRRGKIPTFESMGGTGFRIPTWDELAGPLPRIPRRDQM